MFEHASVSSYGGGSSVKQKTEKQCVNPHNKTETQPAGAEGNAWTTPVIVKGLRKHLIRFP